MKTGDILRLRDNARHDELVTLHEVNVKELDDFIRNGSRGREKLETKHKLSTKGVRGPCVLRSLAYFDVGSSFLTDSLHNIYLGLFVSTTNSMRICLKANTLFSTAPITEHLAECLFSK